MAIQLYNRYNINTAKSLEDTQTHTHTHPNITKKRKVIFITDSNLNFLTALLTIKGI